MKRREKDILLEATIAKKTSPEERLNAVFEVLKLTEELHNARKKGS